MNNKAKGKEKEPPECLSWGTQQWVSWMNSNLFTFSSKPVNSNAHPVGVRPGLGRSHGFPHVFVSALLDKGIHVGIDYVGNAAKSATAFKHLGQQIGEIPLSPNAPAVLINPILRNEYEAVSRSVGHVGTDFVCPRIRQIKLPVGNGEYKVISPLSSPGLSELVNFHLSEIRKDVDAQSERGKADPGENEGSQMSRLVRPTQISGFPVGGQNPQNVGGRIRQMNRPVVLDNLPRLDPKVRHAFSIIFNGLTLRLPRQAMTEYADWWEKKSVSMKEGEKFSLADKQMEKAFLERITQGVLSQVARAQDVLSSVDLMELGIAPDDESNITGSIVSDGWLFPSRRSHAWRQLAAAELVKMMTAYPVRKTKNQEPVFLYYTIDDINRLKNTFEEVIS